MTLDLQRRCLLIALILITPGCGKKSSSGSQHPENPLNVPTDKLPETKPPTAEPKLSTPTTSNTPSSTLSVDRQKAAIAAYQESLKNLEKESGHGFLRERQWDSVATYEVYLGPKPYVYDQKAMSDIVFITKARMLELLNDAVNKGEAIEVNLNDPNNYQIDLSFLKTELSLLRGCKSKYEEEAFLPAGLEDQIALLKRQLVQLNDLGVVFDFQFTRETQISSRSRLPLEMDTISSKVKFNYDKFAERVKNESELIHKAHEVLKLLKEQGILSWTIENPFVYNVIVNFVIENLGRFEKTLEEVLAEEV